MICVVAIGYNRPDSMERLLNSLDKGEYYGDEVALYVSIDKGQRQNEVAEVAERFQWNHGPKEIKVYKEKQGLRKHVLQCGNKALEYDAVVMLEDDISVSPYYYSYIKNAIDYYDSDNRVACISLYAYRVNEFCSRPFEPMKGKGDVYAMQVAQSWGQCWTRRMWQEFRNWPGINKAVLERSDAVPENVNRWRETSWKKNFFRYVVENDKFLIYPYISLSTNNNDLGSHNKLYGARNNGAYQTNLLQYPMDWRFTPLDECVQYDCFFERIGLKIDMAALEIPEGKKACVDLYGMKKDFKDFDYLISTERRKYKVTFQCALFYRPQEMNLVFPQLGKNIYVYDLSIPQEKHAKKGWGTENYDLGFIKWGPAIKFGFQGFKNSLSGILKKKFKKIFRH